MNNRVRKARAYAEGYAQGVADTLKKYGIRPEDQAEDRTPRDVREAVSERMKEQIAGPDGPQAGSF